MKRAQREKKLVTPMALTKEIVEAKPVPVKGKTPVTEWVTITPDLAMKWLDEANRNNRTVRDAHVTRMAADMQEGNWHGLNGEAIRFDTEGRLVDGQHRLWASVVSGCSFESLVVTSVCAEDYSTIGIGQKKTFSDFLGPVHGEKNTILLAAGIRLVYLWRKGILASMKDSKAYPTIAELEQTLNENPLIRESVNRVACMHDTRRLLTASFGVLIHFAGTIQGNPATVEAFLDRLGTGVGLEADDPIFQLRKYLLGQKVPKNGTRRPGQQYILALAIKTWNASKRGEKMYAVPRFTTMESFPVL